MKFAIQEGSLQLDYTTLTPVYDHGIGSPRLIKL